MGGEGGGACIVMMLTWFMVYSSNHYDEDFYSGEVTIAMWICLKSALNSESGDVSVVVMVMRW